MSLSTKFIRVVAAMGVLANAGILFSFSFRFVATKAAFTTHGTDATGWNNFGPFLQGSCGWVGVIVLSPILVPLFVYLGTLLLSLDKNYRGSGIAGAITTLCMSLIGFIAAILIDSLTTASGFLGTLSMGSTSGTTSTDMGASYVLYGPAYLFPPVGFLFSFILSITLLIILINYRKNALNKAAGI